MHILIVSPYFPPQPSIASLRVHSFAQAWAEAGERVTVLTTAKREDQRGFDLPRRGFEVLEIPYRVPRWLEALRHHGRPGGEEPGGAAARGGLLVRGLRRVRERTGIYSSVRKPDLTDYWVRPALEWAQREGGQRHGWDVAFSSSGPYTAHLVARALRRRGLVRTWVADFRDLWTGYAIFPGLFPFTIAERLAERSCLREADLIVTIGEDLARALASRTSRPVEVVPNGFDPEALAAAPPQPIYPADGAVRVVFTGTLYPAGQDPALVMRALAAVRERDPALAARLRLTVAGRSCDVWSDLARRHGVDAMIEVKGLVPRGDALRMQRDADALLLLDWNRPGEGVVTGKLFEYLAASAPVLVVGGPGDSPIASIVQRTKRGVHYGRSPEAFTGGLLDLLRDPARLACGGDPEALAEWRRDRLAGECLRLIRAAHRSRECAGPRPSPAPPLSRPAGGP